MRGSAISLDSKAVYEAMQVDKHYSYAEFLARWKYVANAGRISANETASRLFPATTAWSRSCYHEPTCAEERIAALDELCHTFGVEYIHPSESVNGHYIAYLNVGDPYVPTIVKCSQWVHRYKISIGGYAAFVSQD